MQNPKLVKVQFEFNSYYNKWPDEFGEEYIVKKVNCERWLENKDIKLSTTYIELKNQCYGTSYSASFRRDGVQLRSKDIVNTYLQQLEEEIAKCRCSEIKLKIFVYERAEVNATSLQY